jgi:hypothetical protein
MDATKANRDVLGGVTTTLPGGYEEAKSPANPQYSVSQLVKAYLSAYSAFFLRLNNDDEKGWISGLNMQGNTLFSQFTWNGTGTNVNGSTLQNFIFTKCTSSFVIKAGREADYVA